MAHGTSGNETGWAVIRVRNKTVFPWCHGRKSSVLVSLGHVRRVDTRQHGAYSAVAANIDGQGGDEILYSAGNSLVAVTGNRESGRVLWTWSGPASLGLPAIADVDGNGWGEIVVQDANATVYCLDQDNRD